MFTPSLWTSVRIPLSLSLLLWSVGSSAGRPFSLGTADYTVICYIILYVEWLIQIPALYFSVFCNITGCALCSIPVSSAAMVQGYDMANLCGTTLNFGCSGCHFDLTHHRGHDLVYLPLHHLLRDDIFCLLVSRFRIGRKVLTHNNAYRWKGWKELFNGKAERLEDADSAVRQLRYNVV
jgi:hypothetical protein